MSGRPVEASVGASDAGSAWRPPPGSVPASLAGCRARLGAVGHDADAVGDRRVPLLLPDRRPDSLRDRGDQALLAVEAEGELVRRPPTPTRAGSPDGWTFHSIAAPRPFSPPTSQSVTSWRACSRASASVPTGVQLRAYRRRGRRRSPRGGPQLLLEALLVRVVDEARVVEDVLALEALRERGRLSGSRPGAARGASTRSQPAPRGATSRRRRMASGRAAHARPPGPGGCDRRRGDGGRWPSGHGAWRSDATSMSSRRMRRTSSAASS